MPPPGPEMPSGPAGYPPPGAADFGAQGPGFPPGQGTDYDNGTKTAGVLLTVVLPFISLIAALVLRGAETGSLRRASLRTWAIASGAWLGVQVIAGMIALAAVANSVPQVDHSGPCQGGPALGSEGVPVGHGNYRFDCEFGGSTIVHFGNKTGNNP
jgi:hypothetical protein